MSASNIPFAVAGGVVLVTGAAMGMGRLYALRAAREGAAVVLLWDVDAEGLAFEGARGPLLTPLMTPEDAVGRAWRAAQAGQAQLMAPAAARLGKVLRGILPVRAWDFVGGKVLGIYSTMDKFTGRAAGTNSKAGSR
jgi:hypothetical protein